MSETQSETVINSLRNIAIFVDYDNLTESQQLNGLNMLISSVFLKMSDILNNNQYECTVRLYGGWFEAASLTQVAQDIVAEIQNNFPTIIRIPTQSGAAKIKVVAELAEALMQDPSISFVSTYRRKENVPNVRFDKSIVTTCTDTSCPIPSAQKLIKSGFCPVQQCASSSSKLVYKGEQKLVDTMLACDLLYSSVLRTWLNILISSDDDFVPPLNIMHLNGAQYGAQIYRIHTKPSTMRVNPSSSQFRFQEMDL